MVGAFIASHASAWVVTVRGSSKRVRKRASFQLEYKAVLIAAYSCGWLSISVFWCSVELDFKQQEDKLQPLMKRLCPTEDGHFPPLPYPQEAFTSTPKRKSKAESKKHARWKLWFLWERRTISFSTTGFMRLSSRSSFFCFITSTWLFVDLVTTG